ncbi:NUDIX domain-containing protein [Nonomuraea sp. NBC_01738]|uniref:NUDIX domain-containing protein n=1 Tax=Nonomuraea sp. NBC_01738 TaxID=2976003 RepID=UPI002E15B44E
MTTTYTHPDVFTVGVEQGWADPRTDPADIDWNERLSDAAIPFQVVNGRPVSPAAPTGVRYGRNEFGHWGEAQAADAIVLAVSEPRRRFFGLVRTRRRAWLAMVERDDGHGWALPGGFLELGETPFMAATRELKEETGLALEVELPKPSPVWWLKPWRMAGPWRVMNDPRASDEAWVVAVPFMATLGVRGWDALPPVVGADDARRAAWIRCDSYEVLVEDLARGHGGGRVFAAHRALLAALLG